MEISLKKLPNNLILMRRKTGKTQREVAQAIEITPAALSAYEKGIKTPSLEYALRLAKYYGVSVEVMCGIEDQESYSSKKVKALQQITGICEDDSIELDMEIKSIPWYAHKGLDEYAKEKAREQEDQYGVTDEYKAATNTIYDNTIATFLDRYEKFLQWYHAGEIKEEEFILLKKSYFEKLENAEKASDDKKK